MTMCFEAKFSPEKSVYRNFIVSSLFASGRVQRTCVGILNRKGVSSETQIWEDLVQETFVHLLAAPAEDIIRIYESGAEKLVAFASKIAILKGVARDKSQPDRLNCFLDKIMFTSSLREKKDNEYLMREDEWQLRDYQQDITECLPEDLREFLNELNVAPPRRGNRFLEEKRKINEIKCTLAFCKEVKRIKKI